MSWVEDLFSKKKSVFACVILLTLAGLNPICSQEVPQELAELMADVREATDKQAKILSLWDDYTGGGTDQPIASIAGKPALEFVLEKVETDNYSFYRQVREQQAEFISTESERINIIATYGLLGGLALFEERELIYDPNFSGALDKRDVAVCLMASDLRKQVRSIGTLDAPALQKWKLAASSPNPRDRVVAYLLFRSCGATDAQKADFYSTLGEETSIPVLRIGLISLLEDDPAGVEAVVETVSTTHETSGRATHSSVADEYQIEE